MANKINKQLKKGSPLFDLGQGIASLLDFEAIGRASNPNRSTGTDLTGRGLIHLGAIMAQLDEEEKPAVKEKVQNLITPKKDLIKPENELERQPLKIPPVQPPTPTPTPESVSTTPNETPVVPEKVKEETEAEVVEEATPPNRMPLFSQGVYSGDVGTLDPSPDLSAEQYKKITGNKRGTGLFGLAQDFFGSDIFKGGINWFGEDDEPTNPVKRIAQEDPETFEKFKGLMYKRRHEGESPLRKIAHLMKSPFVRTDQTPDMEGVDYRYMQRATMPEYAKQGFGAAAAEGFNLAIDRANYKKAVQESYDRELVDEMGDLNVEYDAAAGENFNKDRMEQVQNWKDQYMNDKAMYANGELTFAELQSKLDGYVDQAKQFKAAQDIMGQLSKSFADEKGTHDLDASKPEMVDFYNTLQNNPDSFTVKNIDGVQHLVGKTEGGQDVSVPVSKIANGTAGFKLVPNVDPQTYVDAGNKVATGYIEEYATKYGIGKGNVSFEKIQPRMEQYFYSVIGDDTTKLRSLASSAGIGYDEFEQLVNATGDAKKQNMQLLKNDIVQDLMLDFQSQYFPESVTTRYDANKTGIVASSTRSTRPTEGMRKSTQAAQAVANLPALTDETKNQYLGYLPPKLKKDGYTIAKNKKTGQFLILRLDPRTKKLSYAEPFTKEAYQQLLGAEPGFKL